MIRHRFLPLAREELNSAATFYESRVPGLGREFLDDIDWAIGWVTRRPAAGIPAGRGFRKSGLRRFPFSIIYVERPAEIVIVAISHHRRRPGYWRRRA